MTKKAVKRIVKKKQPTKKKGVRASAQGFQPVRKALSQNLTQQNVKQPMDNHQSITQNSSLSMAFSREPKLLSGNSLRSSLMSGLGMTPLFGMGAQQYGNIKNEKNINDGQMKIQALTEERDNDKRTIDDLNAQIKELKGDTKKTKQEVKDKQHELQTAKTQNEIAHDNLDENKRVDLEMEKLTNEMNNLMIQSKEYQRKNEIIKYKGKIDTSNAKLHGLKMEHQDLTKQYESNYYYQELEKVKAEVQMYEMRNKAKREVINSPDFMNPNKALQEQYKQLELKKRENELLQQQEKAQKELIDAQIVANSVPTEEDLAAKMTEVTNDIKQKELEKLNLKHDMYQNQKILNEYNYNVDKRNKLDEELLELNNEKNSLQEMASKLDKQNKGELGINIKNKIQIAAHAKVDLESKRKRMDRAYATQKAKEDAYENQQIIKALENDPIDEEGITNLVKIQNENLMSNEKIQTLTEHRNAQSAQIKAKAQQDWLDSTEYKTLVDENIKKKNEVNSMISATEQMEALNAVKQKSIESAYIMQYKTSMASQEDTSLAAQISYLQTENEKLTKEVQQRADAFSHLNTLMNENPTITKGFFEANPAVQNALSTFGMNLSLDKLNEYTEGFENFVQQNPSYRES